MDEKEFREVFEATKEEIAYSSLIDDKYEAICKSILNRQNVLEEKLSALDKLIERVYLTMDKEASILTPLLEDETISEIMVNGAKDIFVEKYGRILKVDLEFFDDREVEDVIRRIGSSINREINENMPILDARLKDGSRVNGVYKNLTDGKSILTIRKFLKSRVSLKNLIESNTITQEAINFIEKVIKCRGTIFICGGTSSGKTTMLSALMELSARDERIITIEDSREIRVENHENIVQLECRQVNNWYSGEIGLDQLIKTSLRMRPDRLIVGEIRDGKALLSMLNALNTGHSGMSTGHSNTNKGMIRRMESLYMQESNFPIESIDEQLVAAIDIMIQMNRLEDGRRYVKEIGELVLSKNGRAEINVVFKRVGGELVRTTNSLERVSELYGE